MKLPVLLLVLSSIFLCSSAFKAPRILSRKIKRMENVPPILPDQYFDGQKLDHFNETDTRVWSQRYFIDDSMWTPGNPIFVQFGEEGPASSELANGLQMASYGKPFGALLVAIEHRYYGKSLPLADLSTENLQYLSVQQALADYKYFIEWLKQTKNSPSSKVVVFGCSYIGSGAAWFQLTYPGFAVGAVASSAPVLAVVDMVSYLEQVGRSINETFGTKCDIAIRKANVAIQSRLNAGKFDEVASDFQVCVTNTTAKALLSDPLNVQTFWSTVTGNVMGAVQYDNEHFDVWNVSDVCNAMVNSISPYAGIVNVTRHFNNGNCMDISYADEVASLQDITVPPEEAANRLWTYQTCTEFGYFQSTDGPTNPFAAGNPLPVSYYLELCNDVYNRTFDVQAGVDATNKQYYGNTIPASKISNTAFDNSVLDPWHTLSIQQSISASVPLFLFSDRGHCAAVSPSNKDDPQSILAVRQAIAQNIRAWLLQ